MASLATVKSSCWDILTRSRNSTSTHSMSAADLGCLQSVHHFLSKSSTGGKLNVADDVAIGKLGIGGASETGRLGDCVRAVLIVLSTVPLTDDHAMNRLLRKELELLMDALGSHAYQDFHPGSDNKVQSIRVIIDCSFVSSGRIDQSLSTLVALISR